MQIVNRFKKHLHTETINIRFIFVFQSLYVRDFEIHVTGGSVVKEMCLFSFTGGLDDALNNILNLCNEQNVPFVFALGRRALGRACAKLVPVSVVGIFNYSGTEASIF